MDMENLQDIVLEGGLSDSELGALVRSRFTGVEDGTELSGVEVVVSRGMPDSDGECLVTIQIGTWVDTLYVPVEDVRYHVPQDNVREAL